MDEYTNSITHAVTWTAKQDADHDRRGFALSRELQRKLGADFEIEYLFHTAEGHRERDN